MDKNRFATILLSILILLSTLSIFIKPAASQQTKVKVDPALIEYYTNAKGKQFTITVTIIDVENLYGFDIKLKWNATYLEYLSHSVHVPRNDYSDGVLWKPIWSLANEVNTTEGTYWIGYASQYPAPSFNGSGTVFTMTFRIIEHPVQPEPDASIVLELYSTWLVAYGGEEITHTVENGTVILHALPPVATYLYVEPATSRKLQGTTFTVDIVIENVTDLYGFDISLYYNTTLLDAVSVTEGPFLKSVGNTFTFLNETNDEVGRVRLAIALLGPPAGVDGSGTLFSVTFVSSTENTGLSTLNLQDTELSDSNSQPIEHASIDGQVTIMLVETLTHTVEIGGVEYNFVTVSSSSITNFNYDHPQKIIRFDAEGPTDIPGFTNITIPKSLITLPESDTFIVIFDGKAMYHTRTENATHYTLCLTYGHTAYKVEIEIKQTLIGDLNGDRTVDIYDVVKVAIAYDATPTDPRWNPLADLAAPWGKINIYDAVKVTKVYDKTWTP